MYLCLESLGRKQRCSSFRFVFESEVLQTDTVTPAFKIMTILFDECGNSSMTVPSQVFGRISHSPPLLQCFNPRNLQCASPENFQILVLLEKPGLTNPTFNQSWPKAKWTRAFP